MAIPESPFLLKTYFSSSLFLQDPPHASTLKRILLKSPVLLLGPKLFLQAISYYTVPLLSKLEPQPPPWLWPTAPPRVPRSSSLQTARSPHLFKALTPLPGASAMAKTNIIYVEEKKETRPKEGGLQLDSPNK